jgi:perosamine synthetase
MLCSNNEELIQIASAIRNHAEFYLEEDYLGYNFRMTEAQAAFGRVQLKKIEKILKSFRNNARYVIKKLPSGIEPPYISKKVDHSFLVIGCLYNEKEIGVPRQKFLMKLTENRKHILEKDEKSDIKGINMKSGKLIAAGYTKPLYNVPIYKKMKPKNGCPNVEEIISKSLWMDIHKFRKQSEISEEIDIIKETIKEFQK